MSPVTAPGALIDRERYPIDDLGSERRTVTVGEVARGLRDDGCAVARGFLSPLGLDLLLAEAAERAEHTYYSAVKVSNAYLGDGAPDLPDDHPRNLFFERTNGFVTADLFGPETAAQRLYHWPPLMRFLADCIGKDELFIYDDPVSNLIVNVARPGQRFNWHFDTNEFTITMLLQAADLGGHFEYVPDLRAPGDERYGEVKEVLDGDRSRVKRLTLAPGDLQFFLGRFSLHRVTPNEGATDRLLMIMSFAEEPGMVGSVARVRGLYGKITDAHARRAGEARPDSLVD